MGSCWVIITGKTNSDIQYHIDIVRMREQVQVEIVGQLTQWVTKFIRKFDVCDDVDHCYTENTRLLAQSIMKFVCVS
jgi:hypothetical protein